MNSKKPSGKKYEYQKIYRSENKDKICKWTKTYEENNVKKRRESKADWAKQDRKNNPEKYSKYLKQYRENRKHKQQAVNKLNWAVKSGKIKKPEECSCCGHNEKVNGHHKDYNKPLEVIWLCTKCHKFLHSRIDQCTAYYEQQMKKKDEEIEKIKQNNKLSSSLGSIKVQEGWGVKFCDKCGRSIM